MGQMKLNQIKFNLVIFPPDYVAICLYITGFVSKWNIEVHRNAN